MADRDEFHRPSERDEGADGAGDLGRVVPGRRTLTQTIGGAAGAGAAAAPGKISLTHRLPTSTPMALPYRSEMEAGFGQDFSGVTAASTTREALGGAGGMAQGESVAFAGTPSRHTVAHELAHVVQHREGKTQGEAFADTGKSPFDVAADKIATAMTAFNKGRARLPRPLVIEVLGDRFEISYEVNDKNQLVFVVRYVGPYEVAGDKVKERTLKIATPRSEEQKASNLDVSLVSIHEFGATFDLSGTSAEIAEITFRPQPHPTDGNARSHQLFTRTNDKAGESGHAIFQFDILLPSKDRPAPSGVDARDLEREKTVSALVNLGPDAFNLVGRRFGESNKVHLHFEGAGSLGESQLGTGSLLVPIASHEGPVTIAVLEQALGSIKLDLDGDGQMDVHLVHTAGTGDREPDGTQPHIHYIDAYDRDKVRVGHAQFRVRGAAWEVPAAIDNLKNPPPDSAVPPANRSPEQGDLPTEGAKPILLDSYTDWELRIDADGDRQKELLLRFHQKEAGAPVTITVVQVSTAYSSSFTAETIPTQSPMFMSPKLVRTGDGKNPAEVQLFEHGHYVRIWIAPPVDDAEGRVYSFELIGPGGPLSHAIRFPKETATGNPLATTDPSADKTVAGIRSMKVRLGELADPFLFTLEHAPGGLTFGIAGLNPDGAPGSTSGHRLSSVAVKNFKVVDIGSTQLGVDLTGDETADIVLNDAIGQEIGPVSTPSLLVSRYHQMTVSGPAVAGGTSKARFELRGRKFLGTSEGDKTNREGAGAAQAVVAIGAQREEGADINQLLTRFRAGVSAQVLRAGEKGFISPAMVNSFKELSEHMVRLAALAAAPADRKAAVADSEGKVRAAAVSAAATLYKELEAATTGEVKRERSVDSELPDSFSNPFTGADLKEIKGKSYDDGYAEPSTYEQIRPGPAAALSTALLGRDDAKAARLWPGLQDGVERWAQTRLERELGKNDPLVKQGQYMTAMTNQLTKIKSKKRLTRVLATFIADDSYRKEQGFFPSLPLQLWVWQDDDEETWRIRDLTNPEKPFDGSAGSKEYRRVDNPAVDRPPDVPPHNLFKQLDDKKKYPKGLIRYEIPGTRWADQVVCHAEKKWYEWVQDIGLAVAAIGLGLVTFGTGTVAVVGSYALAASALAGAVAAGGELADAAEHGWLDGMVVMVNLLQIAGSVASAGSIVAGNLVRGARAAHAAVVAGEEGAALWSGRLAKLAAMGGKYYVPLTGAAMVADVASVVVMSVDLKKKLDEIDAALPAGSERDEAKVKLLAMAVLMGGLTVLSVKGDLPQMKSGNANIVLDTINGVPVAHAGGVRAGGVEINVSPRLGADGKPVVDPNLHASARWTGRDAEVKGLTEAELPWYRAWMEQPEKVKFKPNGEPEIIMPRLEGPPPAGLEDKLKAMVKNTDVAVFDKAWARTGDVEAVREANGGRLDIDPTSPIWPTERPKLKEKLTRSLGSERRAEEALSHYESIRTGSRGPGHELHAAQASRLGKVLPDGELDHLRRTFPECEIYVTGGAVAAPGVDPLKSIDVVVVVPAGTTPDLMAAIELRVSSTRLRPDPDYVKAHPTMGTNATLEVKAKAVTREQLFGLASARVAGKAPIELHRIDVPTGPGGRPYTAAELDAMNKAGYEFDPATGQFASRSAHATAGLAGSAAGSLRGPNTVCGGALPSEALGEEVLHKLAAGDANALRVVGVEPPKDFDPRKNEWAIGQRESDKAFVLIRGSSGEIDWSQLPGVKSKGHSHPITDPFTGKARVLSGENGNDWVTMEMLQAGKGGNSLMFLAPSGSDFAFAAKEGKHLVVTPFAHLGGGRIAAPKAGATGPLVQFEILSSKPAGLYDRYDMMVYEADVRVSAGGEVLYEGKMYAYQTPAYSDVRFKKPDNLREVPPDFEVGEWFYRPGAAGGGSAGRTGTASVALQERLKKIGLPDAASDPDMARLMSHVDARTEKALHELLDLYPARVKGLDDWYRGIKDETQADRLQNMMAELREARRLAAENPGAIIDLGADARAPMKHKKDAAGAWHPTADKDKSFDIEVSDASGVTWSSEIKTIQDPIKDAPDITKAVNNASAKVESRAANMPGNEIKGKKEVRIEISMYKGEDALGGSAVIVYDGAGLSTRYKGAGRNEADKLPSKPGKPNPANLFTQVEANLNTPGSNALIYLDRVTLIDASGVLARYDKVGGAFVKVFP